MAERWMDGQWARDAMTGAFLHRRAGYYDEAINTPPEAIDVRLYDDAIPGLITLLEESGYIKPRLDERLRTEDLKITHRLLDLLDKSME